MARSGVGTKERVSGALVLLLVCALSVTAFATMSLTRQQRNGESQQRAAVAGSATQLQAQSDLAMLHLAPTFVRVGEADGCRTTYRIGTTCLLTRLNTDDACHQLAAMLGTAPQTAATGRGLPGSEPEYLVKGTIGHTVVWAVIQSHQTKPRSGSVPAVYSGSMVQLEVPTAQDIADAR